LNQKARPDISVIVSVYEQSIFFRLCLESLKNQTDTDFEVIVADDGSGPEIEEVVKKFRKDFLIKHVWQEDKGFRKAIVLNKAAKVSSGKKLFFVDGDILVHPRGIEVVRNECIEKQYIISRVVRLSKKLKNDIVGKKYSVAKIFSARYFLLIIIDWIFGKTRFLEYGLMLPAWLAHIFQKMKKSKQVFGGCWAIDKSDFESVNGYDNSYVGYGHEDFDIGWWLHRLGVKPKLVTNRLIMFHLYHRKRQESLENKEKNQRSKLDREYWCRDGIVEVREDIILK